MKTFESAAKRSSGSDIKWTPDTRQQKQPAQLSISEHADDPHWALVQRIVVALDKVVVDQKGHRALPIEPGMFGPQGQADRSVTDADIPGSGGQSVAPKHPRKIIVEAPLRRVARPDVPRVDQCSRSGVGDKVAKTGTYGTINPLGGQCTLEERVSFPLVEDEYHAHERERIEEEGPGRPGVRMSEEGDA